ncbi:GNAT family N-acetyltransferase [Microbacterium sp. BK668]|uniref:GNAT family N-acetyltransferase n=1 Tax=Microbacterium sp. BK668 TaxID=2512118 RepID=UPI00105D1E2F|nr:GNAT family N-acetyltransferase [Microbacterium sp. BK668]TDN93253.1 L-amino acid N-acyltransferase YncA [Microbacterium sp. BK668]
MPTITTEPATFARFDDVQHAFDGGGDGRGCQCQWFTLTNAEWNRTSQPQRRELFEHEIAAGPPPGFVAYVDGEAAGWVRVGPRTLHRRITRTRAIVAATAEPLDDASVWTVSCFVVRKEHRGRGLNAKLLAVAIDFARENGARVIEAYPIDATVGKHPVDDLYHGVLTTFQDAGFREVARQKPDRPVVVLDLR